MNDLQHNLNHNTDHLKDDQPSHNEDVKPVESRDSAPKPAQNHHAATGSRAGANHRHSKDEEDLNEQDLSDVEDNYEEPSVQRYLPGIYVDLKLKTKSLDRGGSKIAIPMIVDFYAECLKKYGEEKNFIYEESYLENMRVKEEDMYPELYKFPKVPDLAGDFHPQTTLDNKQIIGFPDPQKNMPIEDNLDDVIWLKNRPNDPLLRCIRSITDRLNIQGIVGDPTSYLKKGGDDMHYDMDDPFFDDSAMLSELKMSKSDILLKRAMEREFSDWTEDEEDLDYTYVEPEDFVADYYGNFERDLRRQDGLEGECKLFFHPAGWRDYFAKIPKQFLPLYYELENSSKKITEPITDKMLRLKIKELLDSIYKKLVKLTDLTKTTTRSRSSKKKVKQEENEKEGQQEAKEPGPDSPQVKQEGENENSEQAEKANSRSKVQSDEVSRENFRRRGLNCLMPFRIVDINGKILRWIVKSITAMTNSCSPYEIHCEWFAIVVANNERVVNEYSNKLRAKLTSKLQAMKPKRVETMINMLSESTKTLSKSVGIIRKLLKEHRDLTGQKHGRPSQKHAAEQSQKKSLIEISLDSTRDDNSEYMELDQPSFEPPLKEESAPKPDEPLSPHNNAFSSYTQESNTEAHKNGADHALKENPDSDETSSSSSRSSASSRDNWRSTNNQITDAMDTNAGVLPPESHSMSTNTAESVCLTGTQEATPSNDHSQQAGASPENQDESEKENAVEEKGEAEGAGDAEIKTPKKSPVPKDDDLESILKQSKIMRRVRDVYSLFRLVGTEVMAFVQMNNLAISVANKVNDKEFRHVVEHLGLTQTPFDQTYKRLGELVSRVLQEQYNIKVNMNADVIKVVVIKLQKQLNVEELYEKKNKKPLLLFNNSKVKASPGRVFLDPPKKSTKKSAQSDQPGGVNQPVEDSGPTKEAKESPRKKGAASTQQSKAHQKKTKAEEGDQSVSEPAKKKKKRTQQSSRVNSLKDLLLSRLHS